MVNLRHWLVSLLLLSAVEANAHGQARFDLIGPKVDVRVTRAGVSLPIAAVPNLEPGDVLWLHPDLPASQSVHYLLIAAFLRGTTNPPPDDWFTRVETWKKDVREEGVTITVPQDAEQAVLFLAPETGGDFSTLRSAVKGRPGVFVRASQDLAEAGFEQARIEKYLDEMKKVPPGDSSALVDHSNLLARTLALKPNPDCFKRPLDTQYTCLTQTGTQTLLDDGHGQTIAQALSNGTSSDLITQASYTQAFGGGNYSAYIGAIVDLVRLTATIHVAQYQYIPAIGFPKDEQLNLRLNTPPSFHNPKSVIVIGLPTVQKSTLPPLRPAEPDHISCLLNPKMVLPIEGAPLVFSTSLAHHLVLHLNVTGKLTGAQDLPLLADAYQGGLVFAPASGTRRELSPDPDASASPATSANAPTAHPPEPAEPKSASSSPAPLTANARSPIVTGTIEGMWGFDHFTGPTLPLQREPGGGWHILADTDTPDNLIVGKPNHLALMSTGTACVSNVRLEPAVNQTEAKLEWKLAGEDKHASRSEADGKKAGIKDEKTVTADLKADESAVQGPLDPAKLKVEPVDITLNLQHAATPGSIRLAILQYGAKQPEQLGTKTFAEPARIEALRFHTGDTTAALTGTSLDQVKSVTLKDWTFAPAKPAAAVDEADAAGSQAPESTKPLTLSLAADSKSPNLKPNEKLTAQVHLEDGRTLNVPTLILPARPSVSLLSRRVSTLTSTPIQMTSPSDLPLGAQLIFFLKSKTAFPRAEEIEIANLDDTLHTTLTVPSNTLTLEDSHTVLATFDPMKTFGNSTFGPFRLRAVAPDGTRGEWMPLATIVRLPTLTSLHCPPGANQPCQLSGSGLYLISAVAADADFGSPVEVPDGFVETTISLPHPAGPSFYLKLRDDPETIQTVSMPVQIDTPVAAVHGHSSLSRAASSQTPLAGATSPDPTPSTLAPATPK